MGEEGEGGSLLPLMMREGDDDSDDGVAIGDAGTDEGSSREQPARDAAGV